MMANQCTTCLGKLLRLTGSITAERFSIAVVMPLCATLLGLSSHANAAINSLPAVIEAESYSAMKNIGTEITTDTGGGKNIGWIDANDWMTYANLPVDVPVSGSYRVTYRLASLAGGGQFTLKELPTNTTLDTVTVPKTAGWQNWISISRTISLSAGIRTFGIKSVVGGFNLNWFKLESLPVVALSSASSLVGPLSSRAASSKPASSLALSSKAAAKSSSVASSGVLSTQVAGPVAMSWIAPSVRENGSYLDITELGGYQIRYKLLADSVFSYVSINDPWTRDYYFSWLEGNYVFQIASFDKVGNYSRFVNVISN